MSRVRPLVYALSEKYGPPRITLRDAEILVSFGDATYATRPLKHVRPEDVSREDLDFYGWVYPFMGFKDLLFYLYPIAFEYSCDKEIGCIDSFMYTLNIFVPSEAAKLPVMEQAALRDGLRWIFDAAPLGYADWVQCPNLQAAISVSVDWDDVRSDGW